MRETRTLPIDYLRNRLRYEPETGKLFWLDYEGMSKSWRSKWAGKEAFTTTNKNGYRHGLVDGVHYRAHRVAYAIYHGEWPAKQIDHKNGVRVDNRITNLRVVTNQENQRNTRMRSDNTSSVTGVHWSKSHEKWCVKITIDGQQKFLGYFNTVEEAAAVRKQADFRYGFSERHGLPTNVGEACD